LADASIARAGRPIRSGGTGQLAASARLTKALINAAHSAGWVSIKKKTGLG
jgi:hypothetical protein